MDTRKTERLSLDQASFPLRCLQPCQLTKTSPGSRDHHSCNLHHTLQRTRTSVYHRNDHQAAPMHATDPFVCSRFSCLHPPTTRPSQGDISKYKHCRCAWQGRRRLSRGRAAAKGDCGRRAAGARAGLLRRDERGALPGEATRRFTSPGTPKQRGAGLCWQTYAKNKKQKKPQKTRRNLRPTQPTNHPAVLSPWECRRIRSLATPDAQGAAVAADGESGASRTGAGWLAASDPAALASDQTRPPGRTSPRPLPFCTAARSARGSCATATTQTSCYRSFLWAATAAPGSTMLTLHLWRTEPRVWRVILRPGDWRSAHCIGSRQTVPLTVLVHFRDCETQEYLSAAGIDNCRTRLLLVGPSVDGSAALAPPAALHPTSPASPSSLA